MEIIEPKYEDIVGEVVTVESNPETTSFDGYAVSMECNPVDGVLISVLDEYGEIWDVEVGYIKVISDS